MLTLNDNIVLVSSTGYEGRLSEAVIDMKKGNVVSEKPVWVKLLNGFLNAKRLEVVDNGAVLRFDGGVAMTLQPARIPLRRPNHEAPALALGVIAAMAAPAPAAAQGPRPPGPAPDAGSLTG